MEEQIEATTGPVSEPSEITPATVEPGFVPDKPPSITEATWAGLTPAMRQAVAVKEPEAAPPAKQSMVDRLFSTKPNTQANSKPTQQLTLGKGRDWSGPFRPHFHISAREPKIEEFLDKLKLEVAKLLFHRRMASAFTPQQVAQLYGFPQNLTGKGITIGLIELGGGYDPAQLNHYFAGLGNRCHAVLVGGATNSPGQSDADGEVQLDIEVAGVMAPGAAINVYFAPNTAQGFVDAIGWARTQCQVISISWGQPEDQWIASDRAAMDAALEAAVASGVAVFAASGDSGFTDGEPDGVAHVDYPASSPYAIGCGGTRIIAARGKIESETVWNNGAQGGATGGGVSGAYALPGYQGALSYTEIGQSPQPLKMRGVPDVAALGDPITGYIISVNGQRIIVGGTSAVSPLYSALYALILEYRNTTKKPPPDFLKAIYKNAKPMKLFRDIIAGNNSYYEATVGYDCCTGLGSPNGIALADFFHNNL